MKKTLVLLLSVFFLVGCNDLEKKTPENTTSKTITSEEVLQSINNKEELVIIDVREENEYNTEHVDGAINVSVTNIESIEGKYDKDTKIIVYCRSGKRSKQAQERLNKIGFTNVYDLGGISSITLNKVSEEK